MLHHRLLPLLQMLFGLLFANEYDGAKAPCLLCYGRLPNQFSLTFHMRRSMSDAREISWISAIALLVHIAALRRTLPF